MSELIKPGEIAEWHTLVLEAQNHVGYTLDENLQSYLVLTLTHYTTDDSLAKTIIGVDFLRHIDLIRHGRRGADKLRKVGDRCLILSGFFPQYADKLNVNVEYYYNIGQQAYFTVADCYGIKYDPNLFYKLSHDFTKLTNLLMAMRKPYSFPTQYN